MVEVKEEKWKDHYLTILRTVSWGLIPGDKQSLLLGATLTQAIESVIHFVILIVSLHAVITKSYSKAL